METATERVASVWRNRNFVRLWSSDTISQFGTQFSGLAIPFTFVLLSKDPFLSPVCRPCHGWSGGAGCLSAVDSCNRRVVVFGVCGSPFQHSHSGGGGRQ